MTANVPASPSVSLPSGTVTLLFTDIEGSTRLWETHGAAMRAALARHDALLRRSIEARGGHVFKTVGDAFCAAFATAPDGDRGGARRAARAARGDVAGRRCGCACGWRCTSGAVEVRDGDYFGAPLNRVARLLAAGHGGQTLLSESTHDLCRDHLPPLASVKALGDHDLKDLAAAANGVPAVPPGPAAGLSAAEDAGRTVGQGNAVDRRAAVRQPEPRRGERVLLRRPRRRAAERAGEDPRPARRGAHVVVPLQGQGRRHRRRSRRSSTWPRCSKAACASPATACASRCS